MAASRVRADHEQLTQIAQRFGSESERTRATLQTLQSKKAILEGGDWIGRGATKFYTEMDQYILPSVKRLADALGAAQQTTTKISRIMKAAEDEAAALFKGKGASGGSSGSSLAEKIAKIGIATVLGGPLLGVVVAADQLGAPGTWSGKGIVFAPKYDFSDGKWSSKKSVEIKGELIKGALVKEEFLGGRGKLELGGGAAGLKFGVDEKGQFTAGGYAEIYAAKVKAEGTLVGDQDLGWTGGVEARALSAEGFIGIKDSSVGGSIGFNVASVKAETGANVAGYNVGVNAEVGLKFELGFQVGKNTKVKLGPFTFGLSFGGAKK